MRRDRVQHDEDAVERIYNCDETGFNTDATKDQLFFKKSAKDTYEISPKCGNMQYSVPVAGSAAGEYFPPLVVYKGVHLYENWTSGGPYQCKYART